MKLLAFATAGLLALAACGSDQDVPNDDDARAEIQACVANGGTPYYTTNGNGYVEFITCDSSNG